jgi:cyanophycinase-like exopeptidase
MMDSYPGSVVLFGSGETSPSGRKIFEDVFQSLPASPRIVLLETPAGFELNSEQVVGRIASFLRSKLQNFKPQIDIIPARNRSSVYSPDNPDILEPILRADMIFLGPGSPTYAIRQLKDSLAWNYILARHRLGATVVLASAAVIAFSTFALPVYEIYKVGEDLHWKPGLDFFGLYQVPLVFVPHWNNNDGGEELDTSRCFMGQKRFGLLRDLLPQGLAVLGLDEKTALVINPGRSECRVSGLGGVTILHTGHDHVSEGLSSALPMDLVELSQKRESHLHHYKGGESFTLQECFPLKAPSSGEGLPEAVWQHALDANHTDEIQKPPQIVLELVTQRQAARVRKDWSTSDALRDQIATLGWRVLDSREGQKLEKL